MFFAALGKEKKLLALAKADRGFVGQRNISGGEGDINSASGQCEAEREEPWLVPGVGGRCRVESIALDRVALKRRMRVAAT